MQKISLSSRLSSKFAASCSGVKCFDDRLWWSRGIVGGTISPCLDGGKVKKSRRVREKHSPGQLQVEKQVVEVLIVFFETSAVHFCKFSTFLIHEHRLYLAP
jgi:hypothetical protein